MCLFLENLVGQPIWRGRDGYKNINPPTSIMLRMKAQANVDLLLTFPFCRLMKAQALGDTSSLEFMRGRRILEINPDHPIIKDLNVSHSTHDS